METIDCGVGNPAIVGPQVTNDRPKARGLGRGDREYFSRSGPGQWDRATRCMGSRRPIEKKIEAPGTEASELEFLAQLRCELGDVPRDGFRSADRLRAPPVRLEARGRHRSLAPYYHDDGGCARQPPSARHDQIATTDDRRQCQHHRPERGQELAYGPTHVEGAASDATFNFCNGLANHKC
jgi:hypothetical protein